MPEPRIVAFLCNGCAYAAADGAGRAKLGYPQSLLPIRVMCTGRVEPAFILQAFREGADGVLVAGCHPGDCHYLDGNLRAAARHALLLGLLGQLGVSAERCRLEWIGASQPDRFAEVAREMTERIRALGPLKVGSQALDEVERALWAAEPRRRPEPPPAAMATTEGKPKIAFYWNASCGGCEEAVLDLNEDLLPVLERVEVVLWPVALDHKRKDVEALPDGAIAVTFLNGAIRLDEQEEWARLLRRKSQRVVAFGACAHTGGIVGLGNLTSRGEILETAYRSLPSVANPGDPTPGAFGQRALLQGRDVTLSPLRQAAVPLSEVVEVDYVLPGCPPSPAVVAPALARLLGGDLPPRGAVLAPDTSLCEVCTRHDSKPERIEVTTLADLATTIPDAGRCFLAQGIACMGPATRSGCEPGCVGANMPCRGCFGPLDGVADPGAAMLSALASLFQGDAAEVARLAGQVADPVGTFYRYGLASHALPGRPGAGR